MRTLLIAANWKMNPGGRAEAVALAQAVKAGIGHATAVRAVLCPPAVFLAEIDKVLEGSPIGLGAQNMHWEACGAYTGELSAAMLLDSGCTHVILGHSERRHGLGETDVQVNRKLHAALAARLIPIVCLGETKEQRLSDETESVLLGQLTGSLAKPYSPNRWPERCSLTSRSGRSAPGSRRLQNKPKQPMHSSEVGSASSSVQRRRPE